MNNSDVLLQAANLTRCRPDGDARLLDDVSLSVCAGEKLSVTGASGSGKTLLLRALALLDPPDAGRVCYQGQVVLRDGVPGFRRAAIYLHQRPALLEETVEAALRRPFSLSVHRRKRFDRGRILEWLGRLGRSESFLGQRVGELSGGETQIVALLRALQLDDDQARASLRFGLSRFTTAEEIDEAACLISAAVARLRA